MSAPKTGKVGIIGSGLIGRSWAMLFVGAGYDVCLYDLSAEQLTAAKIDIEKQLKELERNNCCAGLCRPPSNWPKFRPRPTFPNA